MMFGRLGTMGAGFGRVSVGPRLRPDLAILQSKGAQFFLHDFSRTDLTFQEATGQTLADDAGEAVALALEIGQINNRTLAQVIAAAPELLPSLDFLEWGTTPLAGVVDADEFSSGGAGGVFKSGLKTVGKTYKVEIDFVSAASVTFGVYDANVASTTSLLGQATGTSGTVSFLAQAGTTGFYLRVNVGTTNLRVPRFTLKEIPGNHANRTGSTGARPARDANGLKGDGSDDHLISALLASAAQGTLLIDVDVPATVAAYQTVVGSLGVSSLTRFFVGINTAGYVAGGAGTDSITTIVGTTDFRGQRLRAALSVGASGVVLRTGGANEYSGALAGSPATSRPIVLFANQNSEATAQVDFFNGTIRRVAATQSPLSDVEIDSILNYWSTL